MHVTHSNAEISINVNHKVIPSGFYGYVIILNLKLQYFQSPTFSFTQKIWINFLKFSYLSDVYKTVFKSEWEKKGSSLYAEIIKQTLRQGADRNETSSTQGPCRLDPHEAFVAPSAPAKPEGQTSCCSCLCRN